MKHTRDDPHAGPSGSGRPSYPPGTISPALLRPVKMTRTGPPTFQPRTAEAPTVQLSAALAPTVHGPGPNDSASVDVRTAPLDTLDPEALGLITPTEPVNRATIAATYGFSMPMLPLSGMTTEAPTAGVSTASQNSGLATPPTEPQSGVNSEVATPLVPVGQSPNAESESDASDETGPPITDPLWAEKPPRNPKSEKPQPLTAERAARLIELVIDDVKARGRLDYIANELGMTTRQVYDQLCPDRSNIRRIAVNMVRQVKQERENRRGRGR